MQKFTRDNGSLVLVINHNEEFIARLEGYAFVSYIKDLRDIQRVRNSIRQPSKIHCVVYDNPGCTLSSLDFLPEWKGIPIHIYISGIGDFCQVVPFIPVLRDLDIRIFFYAHSARAMVDAQILSSLGIHSGVLLSPGQSNWDDLNDLIHYSVYGRMIHTPVEPFGYLCSNYKNDELINLKSVWFNTPDRFIHISDNEEIALTHEDMLSGNFICTGIGHLDDIHQHPDYLQYTTSWQHHFLKEEGCAYCPAWRICQGFFQDCTDKNQCREVFSELLTAVEFYQSNNHSKKVSALCQL